MESTTEIINGRPRVVSTFDVLHNGKPAEVKIKKLNYGEFNEIQRQCMKMTMLGTSPKLDLDQVSMNEQSILKSVINAPWTLNDLTEIRNLDREVAELILTKVTELNIPSSQKKEI